MVTIQEHEITVDNIPQWFCGAFINNAESEIQMRTRFIEISGSRVQRVREFFKDGKPTKIKFAVKEFNVGQRTNNETEEEISENDLKVIEENYELFGDLEVSRYSIKLENGASVKLDIFENVFYTQNGKVRREVSEGDIPDSEKVRNYAKMEIEGDSNIISNLELSKALEMIAKRIGIMEYKEEEFDAIRDISDSTVFIFIERIGGRDLEGRLGVKQEIIG